MNKFFIVVAMDEKNGIGKNGILAWHLPPDLKHFKQITTMTSMEGKKNAVIMGRITWESLPEKFKPLPDRLNIVVTSNADLVLPEGALRAGSLNNAMEIASNHPLVESVFVIGGANLFAQALNDVRCQQIYVTSVQKDFQCDVFFPQIPERFKASSVGALNVFEGLAFRFIDYRLV